MPDSPRLATNLRALAADIGETVNFVVPEDRGMKYLDRVETDWAFRIQLPVGTAVTATHWTVRNSLKA